MIAGGTRAHDLACRVGADEFAVLFPETDRAGRARGASSRILVALEDVEAGGVRGHAASAGIAELSARLRRRSSLLSCGGDGAARTRAPPAAPRRCSSRADG